MPPLLREKLFEFHRSNQTNKSEELVHQCNKAKGLDGGGYIEVVIPREVR